MHGFDIFFYYYFSGSSVGRPKGGLPDLETLLRDAIFASERLVYICNCHSSSTVMYGGCHLVFFLNIYRSRVTLDVPHSPVGTPGVQVENTSSVSPACRKRRLKGRRCIAIVADTA